MILYLFTIIIEHSIYTVCLYFLFNRPQCKTCFPFIVKILFSVIIVSTLLEVPFLHKLYLHCFCLVLHTFLYVHMYYYAKFKILLFFHNFNFRRIFWFCSTELKHHHEKKPFIRPKVYLFIYLLQSIIEPSMLESIALKLSASFPNSSFKWASGLRRLATVKLSRVILRLSPVYMPLCVVLILGRLRISGVNLLLFRLTSLHTV